jgi:hypothetical protein
MSQLSFLDCAPSPQSGIAEAVAAPGVPVATVRTGRPAIHVDSAARVRAHRAKQARLDVLIKPEIAETLASIAGELDCSKNELLNSLIRFALTNRNWRQLGLMGSRGAA